MGELIGESLRERRKNFKRRNRERDKEMLPFVTTSPGRLRTVE